MIFESINIFLLFFVLFFLSLWTQTRQTILHSCLSSCKSTTVPRGTSAQSIVIYLFWLLNSRNHGVVFMVRLFVSMQIISIQSFFCLRHIAVRLQFFSLLTLHVELLFVNIFCHMLLAQDLLIYDSLRHNLLVMLVTIEFSLILQTNLFCKLLLLHLSTQLVFMFLPDSMLLLLNISCCSVHAHLCFNMLLALFF